MSVWTDTATTLRVAFTDARDDTITTSRTTTAGAFNSTTGVYAAPATSAPLSAAGATIKYGLGGVGDFPTYQFGEEAAHRDFYRLYLAEDADIQRDDRVTVDASVLDPDLVGDVLIVLAVSQDTHNARKVVVCELET